MEEKKYYSEEELFEMVNSGAKDWLFYVSHHSQDMSEGFALYCLHRGLQQTSETAKMFLDYREGHSEVAFNEGLM